MQLLGVSLTYAIIILGGMAWYYLLLLKAIKNLIRLKLIKILKL